MLNDTHGDGMLLSSSTDPFFRTGNALEAGLWIAIGVGFAVYGRLGIRRDDAASGGRGAAGSRRRCGFAFLVFVAFGLSDVVEMGTGAWWRPWWLFAWKAACVLALLVLLIDHGRRKHCCKVKENGVQRETPHESKFHIRPSIRRKRRLTREWAILHGIIIGTCAGAISAIPGILISKTCYGGLLLVLPGMLLAEICDVSEMYTDGGIQKLGTFIFIAVLGNSLVGCVIGIVIGAVRPLNRKHHADRLSCKACGYNLTGNVGGRCPECGEEIKKEAGAG